MPTILLVDDSGAARQGLARRLAAVGLNVHEASCVRKARSVSTATLATLACAVLDLQLPDGDGTDLAATLASIRAGLPIAFFTCGSVPSLVESARARGPVFLKPDEASVVAWVKRSIPGWSQPPPPPPRSVHPPPTK